MASRFADEQDEQDDFTIVPTDELKVIYADLTSHFTNLAQIAWSCFNANKFVYAQPDNLASVQKKRTRQEDTKTEPRVQNRMRADSV